MSRFALTHSSVTISLSQIWEVGAGSLDLREGADQLCLPSSLL